MLSGSKELASLWLKAKHVVLGLWKRNEYVGITTKLKQSMHFRSLHGNRSDAVIVHVLQLRQRSKALRSILRGLAAL